ncbi:unnamed protein product [Caenorhabditis brenneri]
MKNLILTCISASSNCHYLGQGRSLLRVHKEASKSMTHSFSHFYLTNMNPATSFPLTMDSVSGPSSPQYWVRPAPYGWDATSPSSTPYSYYPYFIPPTDYSTDVQTFNPTTYSSTSGSPNFNPTQDQTFYNHFDCYSATNPSGSLSVLPTPSTTPPTPIAPAMTTSTRIPKTKQTAAKSRKCSNCFTTSSCRWKNVTSKTNILCNTCFIYKRRNGEDRPAKAIIAHQTMQMHLNK